MCKYTDNHFTYFREFPSAVHGMIFIESMRCPLVKRKHALHVSCIGPMVQMLIIVF